VSVAAIIIAFIGAVAISGSYFLSLALQNVLRYGPLSTGAAFLPFAAGMAAATMASSRLVERFGSRTVLTVGLAVGAAGMLGFTRLHPGAGFMTFLLASIPASTGLGASIAPTLSLGASGVVHQEAGMVSGLLNASRQIGGSVALAVLATVASADGYDAAFLISAALLLAAAAVALVCVPREE
jgi:predicted MFS family arabinose efflux permease